MTFLNEVDLEYFLMEELGGLGNELMHGAQLAPETTLALRANYHDTILEPVFLDSLRTINPDIPERALVDASKKVLDTVFTTDVVQENRRLHRLMVEGVKGTYVQDGEDCGAVVHLVDWSGRTNDWRTVNQVDVVGRSLRIPDVVLFLNGMPLVVFELKGTEGQDIDAAFNQIETYKADIPDLFRTMLLNVISDGFNARYGSLSANLDRFMNWRTLDGETLVPMGTNLALETLSRGLLNRQTLLDLLGWCVVFEDEGKGPVKKIAGYHQYFAVRKAMDAIAGVRGRDGKAGVIWHTQGSGKSLLMTFPAGRLMHDTQMENPTLLVLTDRNDLDNQLFLSIGIQRSPDFIAQFGPTAGGKDKVGRSPRRASPIFSTQINPAGRSVVA